LLSVINFLLDRLNRFNDVECRLQLVEYNVIRNGIYGRLLLIFPYTF